MMETEKQIIEDKVVILTMKGAIVRADAEDFLTECKLGMELNKPLVISLKHVSYMTSSIWYNLILTSQQYWLVYRSLLIVTELNEILLGWVTYLKLEDCIDIVMNREQAIAAAAEHKRFTISRTIDG